MEVLHACCCGLDVHKKGVTACVLWAEGKGKKRKEKRQFGTMTRDLLALADWLRACGVTHVAMESTGVYWKPVWNVLEGQFEILLVNAQHIKAVPGRKTDQNDAEWIADLLQHGLLRRSFVPPTAIRELRDLTRYRVSLVQECNRLANRIQKVLEDANIKLAWTAGACRRTHSRTRGQSAGFHGWGPDYMVQSSRRDPPRPGFAGQRRALEATPGRSVA